MNFCSDYFYICITVHVLWSFWISTISYIYSIFLVTTIFLYLINIMRPWLFLNKCHFQNYVKDAFHCLSEIPRYKNLEILYKVV